MSDEDRQRSPMASSPSNDGLSSRSRPTGPGSRGGRWHDKLYRSRWRHDWRLANPDYTERQTRLAKERRRRRNLQMIRRDLPTFTEAILSVLQSEIEMSSYRAVAHTLLMDHTTISRWVKRETEMLSSSIDAVIITYSLRRIVSEYRRLVRNSRKPLT